MSKKKENRKVKMTVIKDNHTINDILCEICLPDRITDKIELIFYPTPEQANQLGWPFEFSVYGEHKGLSGEVSSITKAKKVYYKDGHTRHWGDKFSETILIGEPTDLKIIDLIQRDDNSAKPDDKIKGIFWLTPNIMLSPMKMMTRSFTGEVTVDKSRNFEFTLNNGCSLKFDEYYRYIENEQGDTISFSEPVAEFELDHLNKEIDFDFEPIDDFLMLTSFCSRQRSVCLGWEAYESSKITKFFRRNISIPKINKNHSFNETLVDVSDFKEFITVAYNNFIQTEKKDLLRQSLFRALRDRNDTLETKFLILYSAVETLVLLYKHNNEMNNVIDLSDWPNFFKDLKIFIKKYPLFSDKKNKRKLIYEKLPELNRVSFATAFKSFCEHYHIELSDLWPVVDRKDGISLSDIRNKLIHGDSFGRRQERALMSAAEHLGWIVERSLLRVLDWPIAKSKVSKEFLLKNFTMANEWIEDRKILSDHA